MFILNPPYISELLKNTIRKNGYSVVINNTSLDELGDYQNFLPHAVSRRSRLRGARASKPQPAEHRSARGGRERRFQKIASVHKNSPRR